MSGLSIAQLEELLNRSEESFDERIEILPNGEIVAVGGGAGLDLGERKPLTFRENLGGEYAFA